MGEIAADGLFLIAFGAIGFGIWILVKAGDLTIDAAAAIAERSGLSKLFIAATIVAFGTSAPELFTSVNAHLDGFTGLSVGNVVGSNIANILLVAGVSAAIAPILVDRREVRVDVLVMLAATAALAAGIFAGALPRWAAALMFAALVGYVVFQYRASRIEVDEEDGAGADLPVDPRLMVLLGLAGLVLGSEILVQGAVVAGRAVGVSEAAIGMTVVAFGTSVPELAACVAAARKGQSEMIAGGLLGSNIFNVLSVLALTGLVAPLAFDPRFLADLAVLVPATLGFALALLALGRVPRVAGAAMVALYLVFAGLQYAA